MVDLTGLTFIDSSGMDSSGMERLLREESRTKGKEEGRRRIEALYNPHPEVFIAAAASTMLLNLAGSSFAMRRR